MKNRFVVNSIKVLFTILVISFLTWAIQNNYFSQISDQPEKFFYLLRQHVQLVGLSSLLALLVAIPGGIFLTRPKFRKAEWIIVNLSNLGQTVPSLAVLALSIGFLGLGFIPAVFALFINSVLPILRNTIAGIDSIDPEIIDSAKGMGFKPHQILFQVELPNAAYSIMAGIRTAIVINIGTAALAFLIGGGGLGVWIITGIQMFDNSYLFSGAIPVTILAILVDFTLRIIEKVIIPEHLRRSVAETEN
ncbi:ABC transporter permease [Virgibacillus sp. L01]|uniref:ABC transporter permease n=1 Tax=Virgibacillus sp. L01 TaxID=3457429 RepID=UPI003FCFF8E3